MHKREFRALICSMLLGDGCLSYGKDPGLGRRGNPKPYDVFYAMNHGSNQIDYALWKAKLIDNIFKEKNLPRKCSYTKSKKYDKKYDKTYYGVYVKFRWNQYLRYLRTKAYIQLAEKSHMKDIEFLLENIYLDLHLAIWFMDDAGEKRKQRKSVRGEFLGFDNPSYDLYTYGYTAGQHSFIKCWFERKYDVSPSIYQDKGKRKSDKNLYLKFSIHDSRKLFLCLWPYFSQIHSMRQKFWLSFATYKPEILEAPLLEDEDIVQLLKRLRN